MGDRIKYPLFQRAPQVTRCTPEKKKALFLCNQRVTQALQVIKNTRSVGKNTHTLKGGSPEVQEALDAAAKAVEDQISLFRQELRHYRDGLEWNRLCVVMYGATNSGKSTILEALSHGDGQTIGTGEKDFTRRSRGIPYGPLLLVDTPGIEGGEGKLRQLTRTAVRKAHVVAVVTGTGKEPERGALHKVAKDAQRAGEILSILNLRGRPTAYKRRSSLGTRDTPKLEERIRLAMSQVFADRHTDQLNLNAYLAFVAASRGASGFPSRQHQRDREHTAKIFGTLDEALAFSGIGELVSKLDDLVREARPRILWGNGFKAVTALGDVSSTFLQAASSLDCAAKLQEDLKVEMDRLHQRMNVRLFVIDFDLPDMDEILRKVTPSVGKEMIDVLLSVLGTVFAALLNPILGILTGIMASLRKIWEWFGGGRHRRKREARTRAGRLIDREMAKVRKTMKANLDEGWDRLDAHVLSHLNDAERLASAFQNASDSLQEEAITLDIAATRLTTRFLKIDDSVPERDLLIPVQKSDGLELLVHVGKGRWKLPRLSTLPKLRSYANASAVRRARCMTREQRERVCMVIKRNEKSRTEEGNTWLV